MSESQWALLIIAVVVVVAIYLFSRRDRRAMGRDRAGPAEEPLLPPRDQQLDIFAGGQFDEFGVGKPRRIEPTIGVPRHGACAAEEADSDRRSDSENYPDGNRQGGSGEQKLPYQEATASSADSPPNASDEKIVALLLAGRSKGSITGPRVHAALRAQGLKYGDRNIYHRMSGEYSVFSVASLVKPGYLDPAQANEFSTPGLTLFMVLPGPLQPSIAIRDMLDTADKLAGSLNAQIFNANRQPLTPEASQALQNEVNAWARRHELS